MRNRLSDLFQSYVALFIEAHDLALANDPANAIKLINLRRRLSEIMGQMSHSVVEVNSALASQLDKRSLASKHSTLVSEERAAVARHQASWPAIEMGKNLAGYAEAMAALRWDLEQNHRWRMTALVPQLPA